MRRRTAGGAAASAASAAAIVMLLAAAPASASQDSGVSVTSKGESVSDCSLERLGTQFVRCDDLTGNGVSAPGWVPSRG